MDFEDVAEELYGLPPDDFVKIRTERERQARAAGDRALAARIKALRRPSLAAWIANRLVREQPTAVRPLVQLGDRLREATQLLSAAELRPLTQQRYQLVAALVAEARRVSTAAGRPVSDAVAEELRQTFDAALADPSAAEALLGGRLIGALSYAGFGVPGVGDELGARRAARAAATRGDAAHSDPAQREAARREAVERERQRRAALAQAQAGLGAAARNLRRSVQAAASAAAAFSAAESAYDQAMAAANRAEQQLAEVRSAAEDAESAKRQAAAAHAAAQAAVDRLLGEHPPPG